MAWSSRVFSVVTIDSEVFALRLQVTSVHNLAVWNLISVYWPKKKICWPTGSSASTTHHSCRPRQTLSDHTLWLKVEEGRENRVYTHSRSTSVGRSSAEEMTKLNSLCLLSCSGKLYIQLYPYNPNTQTCQAIMLLQ